MYLLVIFVLPPYLGYLVISLAILQNNNRRDDAIQQRELHEINFSIVSFKLFLILFNFRDFNTFLYAGMGQL